MQILLHPPSSSCTLLQPTRTTLPSPAHKMMYIMCQFQLADDLLLYPLHGLHITWGFQSTVLGPKTKEKTQSQIKCSPSLLPVTHSPKRDIPEGKAGEVIHCTAQRPVNCICLLLLACFVVYIDVLHLVCVQTPSRTFGSAKVSPHWTWKRRLEEMKISRFLSEDFSYSMLKGVEKHLSTSIPA